ncbi:MAG: hypothetical protein F6J90_21235 [Moorea sp. SIOASIH]|uniref:hypothetical protein n=1 Tax=Moorena sp. SIOASIH TaxID=2607817 RepID=UPI0013B974DD|nr:hypothetical protein [Moorena sp. SIOASIH]NEO38717.1 hypothetical protein [Moorena sp. SIOASIH]
MSSKVLEQVNHRESLVYIGGGNREQGTGNREQAKGKRQKAKGKRQKLCDRAFPQLNPNWRSPLTPLNKGGTLPTLPIPDSRFPIPDSRFPTPSKKICYKNFKTML